MRDKFLKGFSIAIRLTLFAISVIVFYHLFGETGLAVAAVGGVIIPGAESDSQAVRTQVPELDLADVAKDVSKFNSSRFFMDTLFRNGAFGMSGKIQKANSLVKRFYGFRNDLLSDTLAASGLTGENDGTTSATAVKSYTYTTGDGQTYKWLAVNNSERWKPETLIIIRDLNVSPTGQVADSGLTNKMDIVFFVEDVVTGAIKIRPIHGIVGKNALSNTFVMPNFPSTVTIYSIGSAKDERALVDAALSFYPTPDTNYCQYFIRTVSESMFQKMQAKEVEWDIRDMLEIAIYNLRAEIEGATLWGEKAVVTHNGRPRYTMRGITRFINNAVTYTSSGITQAEILNIFKQAFTGNNGSERKLLIAGVDFLTNVMAFMMNNTTFMRTEVATQWGVVIKKWETDLGLINVAHHPLFTELGWRDKAVLLDMEYVYKAEFLPFTIKKIDQITAGISNEEVYSLSEVSTVWIDNPDAHFLIIPA